MSKRDTASEGYIRDMLHRSAKEGPLLGHVYVPSPLDDGGDPSKVTVTIDRALLEAWRRYVGSDAGVDFAIAIARAVDAAEKTR